MVDARYQVCNGSTLPGTLMGGACVYTNLTVKSNLRTKRLG